MRLKYLNQFPRCARSRSTDVKNKIILFFVAFIVWILLNWPPDWQHAITGAVVAVLIMLLIGNMFTTPVEIMHHPMRYMYFIFYYVPVFLWEVFKANVDVAYRVGHPSLPIKPGIVKVKTSLKSPTALTFLANSITLTPGTMTVDIDEEKGVLYVHWINVTTQDETEATRQVVERFEKILEKIFE
ncbi:MAG: cation:proton antiporter [Elusimicrobia bacterium]|nr:cation:proton antiporter [Elusimicrobiota bacterium]MBD3411587.1 cation:proton antiporter [Elusimicrobiota bacterium]